MAPKRINRKENSSNNAAGFHRIKGEDAPPFRVGEPSLDLLALSRQRNQTIILIIQNLALLEKSGTRFGYSMISKFTPMLTITQERPELIDFLMGVQAGIENRLAAYPALIPQQVAHINTPFSSLWDNKFKYYPDYTFQYYSLNLPSFWTEELSTFWSRYT